MNTQNGKTSEVHKFKLSLTDKLSLKDPKKNMVLANLSIYYTWKNINSNIETTNLKLQPQLGMMNLI